MSAKWQQVPNQEPGDHIAAEAPKAFWKRHKAPLLTVSGILLLAFCVAAAMMGREVQEKRGAGLFIVTEGMR